MICIPGHCRGRVRLVASVSSVGLVVLGSVGAVVGVVGRVVGAVVGSVGRVVGEVVTVFSVLSLGTWSSMGLRHPVMMVAVSSRTKARMLAFFMISLLMNRYMFSIPISTDISLGISR